MCGAHLLTRLQQKSQGQSSTSQQQVHTSLLNLWHSPTDKAPTEKPRLVIHKSEPMAPKPKADMDTDTDLGANADASAMVTLKKVPKGKAKATNLPNDCNADTSPKVHYNFIAQ